MAERVDKLVRFDADLLARVQAYADEWCAGNSSRAIREACERMLAGHAAHVAREQRAAADPNRWVRPATSDRRGESAPITSRLLAL